ncbi:MAG: HAMP domain-containing histidine kinase [Planctomycetes bacterium]|nr:HAMP domain-containing histidine kinase [Planctomycetota bacterium]
MTELNPMAKAGGNFSGETPSPRPAGPADCLINQLRAENDNLFETVQHFFRFQEEILRLRGFNEPKEAYPIILDLLKSYLQVEAFEVFLQEDGSEVLPAVYQYLPLADGQPLPIPFSAGEQKRVLEEMTPVIKSLRPEAAGEDYYGLPTAILTPLIYRLKPVGLAALGLRAPAAALPGFRLQTADYLLKELAAFVAHHNLSSAFIRIGALNRGIIESVRQGVVAVDREGRIVCSNPAAKMVISGNFFGRSYEEVMAPELVPIVRNVITEKDPREPILDLPVEVLDQEGKVIPLMVSATPLELNSAGSSGWVFVFQDVSLHVEVQNLRTLDVLKSEYLLGLIHDMKTPLAGIISGCDLLLVSKENFTAEQFDILKIVEASAERLQSLALDFLELSALRSTVADEPKETVNLAALAERVVEPFMLQSQRHHLHLEKPAEPVFVLCEPHRIIRVFENLISNAIKYSPQGGNIWMRISRTENVAQMAVQDEGIGIKKSDLASIWESFRRAPSNRAKGIEGTGLGLSIVKMIVDKHRGRVTVDSEYGKGTTFTVFLPLAPSQQPSIQSPPPSHKQPAAAALP